MRIREIRALGLRSATPEGGWRLHPLNPAFPDAAIPDLSSIHGVIIQKALPGRRRQSQG